MRSVRALWWVVTIAFVAAAAVGLSSSFTPVALLALSVLAALFGWIGHHATGQQTARRCRLPVGLGARIVLSYGVVLTFAGLTALIGPSGGALVGLHAVAWPLAAGAAARRAARRVPDSPAALAPGAGGLSDEQLCLAWCTSSTALTRSPGTAERSRLALLRAGYLDELERRAPAGFAPWLIGAARAGGDPRHLLNAVPEPGPSST